jgi:adenosylhomocysteine nucleosidase
VLATTCGIGTRRAAQRAAEVLDQHQADRLIVIGVAGGVARQLSVGDVVTPAVVEDAATRAEHVHRPPAGTSVDGRIVTTDELIKDRDRLNALAERGVTALDMESAAIAEVCEQRDVDWSVFRGISDDAFDPSVDEAILRLSSPDGSADLRAVARLLAARPTRIRLLARLGRDLKRATVAAVEAALDSAR